MNKLKNYLQAQATLQGTSLTQVIKATGNNDRTVMNKLRKGDTIYFKEIVAIAKKLNLSLDELAKYIE